MCDMTAAPSMNKSVNSIKSSHLTIFFFKIGKPAPEVIGDAEWLKTVFLSTVQKCGHNNSCPTFLTSGAGLPIL